MSTHYRPEVDGLRTIAVGSVLIYHAKAKAFGAPLLPGGFLGVDVFFVISGFLITSLIASEWSETRRFSLLDFYERRVRRLLPALFTVMAAALPAAWLILLPTQMVDFVKSIIASLVFVSNLYWNASLQSYGAEPGLLKPFLHTWSLAVEEQFYILFPLFYVALLKRLSHRTTLEILLGVIVTGLGLAELVSATNLSLSFYGLQSRIWELGCGAALAHASRPPLAWLSRPEPRRWLPALGLVLILVPMQAMRLGNHHPGLGTLSTILGTVLIIGFGGASEPVTRLLSSRPFVSVGLISYSLYLWHYPIFAFGRLLEHEPTWRSKAIWLALTGALSVATYRWVEQPFRDRRVFTRRSVFWSAGAASAFGGAFAALMLGTAGLHDRFPSLKAIYGPNEFDNGVLEDATWQPLAALAAARGYAPSSAHIPSAFETQALWFDARRPGKRVLVVGNSHGKDMFNVFHLSPQLFTGLQFARFGMHATFRDRDIALLLGSPNFAAADTVALSFRYDPGALDRLGALIERFRRRGKQVVMFLNLFEFDLVDGMPIFDWYVRSQHGLIEPARLRALAWTRRASQEIDLLNARLAEIGRASGARVLDKNAFLCDQSAHSCDVVSADGYKTFYDDKHFTVAGARYFGRRIRDLDWIRF